MAHHGTRVNGRHKMRVSEMLPGWVTTGDPVGPDYMRGWPGETVRRMNITHRKVELQEHLKVHLVG